MFPQSWGGARGRDGGRGASQRRRGSLRNERVDQTTQLPKEQGRPAGSGEVATHFPFLAGEAAHIPGRGTEFFLREMPGLRGSEDCPGLLLPVPFLLLPSWPASPRPTPWGAWGSSPGRLGLADARPLACRCWLPEICACEQ